jgi:hypothetical protein
MRTVRGSSADGSAEGPRTTADRPADALQPLLHSLYLPRYILKAKAFSYCF